MVVNMCCHRTCRNNKKCQKFFKNETIRSFHILTMHRSDTVIALEVPQLYQHVSRTRYYSSNISTSSHKLCNATIHHSQAMYFSNNTLHDYYCKVYNQFPSLSLSKEVMFLPLFVCLLQDNSKAVNEC